MVLVHGLQTLLYLSLAAPRNPLLPCQKTLNGHLGAHQRSLTTMITTLPLLPPHPRTVALHTVLSTKIRLVGTMQYPLVQLGFNARARRMRIYHLSLHPISSRYHALSLVVCIPSTLVVPRIIQGTGDILLVKKRTRRKNLVRA